MARRTTTDPEFPSEIQIKQGPVAGFGAFVLVLTAWLGLAQTAPAATLELDPGAIAPGSASCRLVESLGRDVVFEYLDGEGRIRHRAGSWLGRDGVFPLQPADDSIVALRARSLDHRSLTAEAFELNDCPDDLPAEVFDAWSTAMDRRLGDYFGGTGEEGSLAEADLRAGLAQLGQDGPARWRAHLHFELGALLRARDRLDEARGQYRQALALFDRIGQQNLTAAAWNALGLVAWRLAEGDEAWRCFDRALAIREALGDLPGVGDVANNLGLLLSQQGQYRRAQEFYELALSIFQGDFDLRAATSDVRQGYRGAGELDIPSALNVLNNLALLMRYRGQVEVAERYWRNYLALQAQVPRASAVAEAQSNLARMLVQQGRLDEAALLLISALEQFETAGQWRWVAEASIGLSELYAALGDTETGLSYARAAVDLDLEDHAVRADAWRALGKLLADTGSATDALAALAAAGQLFEQAGRLDSLALVASEQAWIRFQLGQAGDWLAQHEHAEAVLVNSGNQGAAARVRSRIGAIEHAAGDRKAAAASLHQAWAKQRQVNDAWGRFLTLDRLAHFYHDLEPEQALRFNQLAIEQIRAVQHSALPALQRAEYMARRRGVFDRQVTILLAADRVNEAWVVADSARARLLERRRAQTSDHRQLEQLLDQRSAWLQQLFEARLASNSQGKTVDSNMLTIRRNIDRVEFELARAHQAEAPPATSVPAVQAMLGEGRVLLSYYQTERRLLLWVVGAGFVDLIELGEPQSVADAIEELLQRIRRPRTGPARIRQLSRQLYQDLLAPAAARIDQAVELLVQPDGALHSLPFALLLGEAIDGDRRATQRPPELSFLLPGWSARKPDSALSSEAVLVLADPAVTFPEPDKGGVYPADSLVMMLSRDRRSAALPGSRQEAQAIFDIAGGEDRVYVKTGVQASRQFLIEGGLRRFGYVHLATHGLVDLKYPELSSLLLSSGEALGPAFLRPHEIAELDINAELVVLSGCETGHGRLIAGSGALSLARAFLVAGAKRVVASLWKVDDQRTVPMMSRFYHHLLIDGHPPARALREAGCRPSPIWPIRTTGQASLWSTRCLDRAQR